MIFPLVLVKMDNGYDLVLNIAHIVSIQRIYDSSDYRLTMIGNHEIKLTWKEYNKLDTSLQNIAVETGT